MPTNQPPSELRALRVVGVLTLACLLAIPTGSAMGQATAPTAAVKPAAPAKPAASHADGPLAWNALSASQQTALRPLAPTWSRITPNRKRKWIALSANFNKLSAAEQATLHGRMAQWATLSNADRNRARLNFAETRSLSSREKMAQWEAYQALSPTQKQHLAREAAKRPPIGAAPAVAAPARDKLASVPITRSKIGTNRSNAPVTQVSKPPAPGASAATPPASSASAATPPGK